MSLERLKKYSDKIAKIAKILYYVMILIIFCETVSFAWQALMPGKLTNFFNIFRIYAPFISNIDNNALCLFELAGNLFNNLFIFAVFHIIHKTFKIFSANLNIEEIVPHIKKLAVILIAESFAVPIMKSIAYAVFVKLPVPTGTLDFCPVIIGLLLYFIAIMIQSTYITQK